MPFYFIPESGDQHRDRLGRVWRCVYSYAGWYAVVRVNNGKTQGTEFWFHV